MAQRLTYRLRTAVLAVVAVLGACVGVVLATGQAGIVITHGVSMNPLYHQGDLVIIARASSYTVGDIAAYNLPGRDEVALHRIIGGNDAAFVFKGDNNQSVDPITPPAADLVGRSLVHIPQGGLWLETLTSPPILGLLAFALLAGGGAATTRHRRKRRRASMSRHISTRPPARQGLGGLPPSLRIPTALAAVFGVAGVILGALAWSGPLEETASSQVKSGTRMNFSYTADVGQSAAYDGTTAKSPGPVFRKLARTVDVGYSYHGEPGTVTVTAELSTPGGWHSTLPLSGPVTIDGSDYEGSVRLDLASLDAKAQAASAVTGLPAGPVSVALTPAVRTAAGAEFRPELKLELTPLQLTLPGGPGSLAVTDSATQEHTALVPRMVGVSGLTVTAAAARVISAVFLLAALATGIIILVFARRSTPADEAAAIRRRYAALLVRVHPMPAPQGRPVIDVTTFPTLAKLAERYGLLVLHWSRSGVETFVVQDENITYRYRAGSEPAQVEPQPEPADSQA
ncbi:signal peptidase I [Arthrobacter sp. B2I5]|uniref:signal peptidase I n=1 Tax=Arthrobacter sp. B2I5 TaxID=3042266 RepID=UPI00277DBC71|nr:signal peptidase I [Arthrobacter sp. B2I5]MDQ0826190.1 signal peptidase I [Arthrobacter sp. B2I5]